MLYTVLFLLLIAISIYVIITECNDCKETFVTYLGIATKCFDCEKQFPPEQKWRGQPSKCFSCERELAAHSGNQAVYQGKQQKCFDCGL